jgi:hypothetical protein
MKYLKQKGSGHVYVWSEALSQRDDMEPYEPPAPQTPAENAEEPSAESSGLEAALENFRRDVSKRKPKAGEA